MFHSGTMRERSGFCAGADVKIPMPSFRRMIIEKRGAQSGDCRDRDQAKTHVNVGLPTFNLHLLFIKLTSQGPQLTFMTQESQGYLGVKLP